MTNYEYLLFLIKVVNSFTIGFLYCWQLSRQTTLCLFNKFLSRTVDVRYNHFFICYFVALPHFIHAQTAFCVHAGIPSATDTLTSSVMRNFYFPWDKAPLRPLRGNSAYSILTRIRNYVVNLNLVHNHLRLRNSL